MSDYVYLLSDYGEYGSHNMIGTRDRSKLRAMMVEHWEYSGNITDLPEYLRETTRLAEALARQDDDLAKESPIELSFGWGGVQLHVVKVDA